MSFSPTTSATTSSSTAGRGRALHLRLPLTNITSGAVTSSTSSTPTSFKRSLEELFGGIEEDEDRISGVNNPNVDYDSAIAGGGSGETGTSTRTRNGTGRNNKRQRSESCAPASLSSSSGSSSNSGSSSVFASPSTSDSSSQSVSYDLMTQRSYQHHSCPAMPAETASSLPPRLPTPRLDDVQMSDIPLLDDDQPSVTITAAATGGLIGAALPMTTTGRGNDAPDDSWSLRLPQVQCSGELAESLYKHCSQQQCPHNCILAPTTNNRNQPLSIPALPAPIPRSHTPLPSLPLPSNVPSLPLIETSPGATTAGVSAPHGSGMDAGTAGSLNLRSSPPSPLLLSLSLPSCADLSSGSDSSMENTRQGTSCHVESGSSGDRFRATMERYNEFESAMAALRRPVSPVPSPLLGASSTEKDGDRGARVVDLGIEHVQGRSRAQVSPPRLPPLGLSVEEEEYDDNGDERGQQGLQQRVWETMYPRGGGSGRQRSNMTPAANTDTNVNRHDDRRTTSLDSLPYGHLSGHHRLHEPLYHTINTSVDPDSTRYFNLASPVPGSGSSRTHARLGRLGEEILIDREEELDELDEDEEQIMNELDGQDGQHVIAPATVSLGHANNASDAPPRIELELSGVSAGFGRSIINEDEGEGEDERGGGREEGSRNETHRIMSVSSTSHGLPPPFRDRLDSALEALRSPSPLVPEFNTSITTTIDSTTSNNSRDNSNSSGVNENPVTFDREPLIEGLDRRRHFPLRRDSIASPSTAAPSRGGYPSIPSVAIYAHNYGGSHQAIDAGAEEIDVHRRLPPRAPISSPTTTSASGFTSIVDLIRANTARRRLSICEEQEEIVVPNRRSLSIPQSQDLIPDVLISPDNDSATLTESTFSGRSGPVAQHQSGLRRSTLTSSRFDFTSSTRPRLASNPSNTVDTNYNNDLTAITTLRYNPLPLSELPLVDSTRPQPPVLPPIVADTRIDHIETDDRGDNRSEEYENEERRQSRHLRRILDGIARDSRLRQERHQTQTIERENVQLPEVPSPSLSGLYDWLEGASVNARMTSASINAPVSVATAGLPGDSGREGEVSGSYQRHGQGSWEEDVFSGFMTTDLGLSLALQQERVNAQSIVTNIQTTPPQISTAGGENNIGGSDTEREREVERLPWTLNVPAASWSGSHAIPPRHDFPRQESREMQSSGRYPICHSQISGRNPVHSRRQWQRDGTYALTSASTSTSSLPTTTSRHPSTLFFPTSSSPTPLPSTQTNASPTINIQLPSSSSRKLPSFSASSLRTAAQAETNGSTSRSLLDPDPTRNLSSATVNDDTEENVNAAATSVIDYTGNTRPESLSPFRLPQTSHSRGLQQTNPGWHPSPSERSEMRTRGDDSTVGSFASRTGRTRVASLTTRIGSDISLVAENAAELRRRNAREDVLRLNSRLEGLGSRGLGSMERTGLFGGLALPPSDAYGQIERNGTDIILPLSQPRPHSVRQTPIVEDENSRHHNSIEGRYPFMTTREAMNAVSRLPPHYTSTGPVMRLSTDSEGESRPEIQRNATRVSDDSSFSDSSISVDSFVGSGSGMSSASAYSGGGGGGGGQSSTSSRAVFLDTELPSPGLGELFDSLVSNSTAAVTTATCATESTQSLVGSSGPASAASSTTFTSSTSSSASQLTSSPVCGLDDEVRGITHESERFQSMERLGRTREQMSNSMLRWDRDDESILFNSDETSGESPSVRNAARLRDQRPLFQGLYRSDLSSIQLPATTNNPNSSVRASANSETRNRIIDPSLFAPGPFRNTMENLATRARESTAQGFSTQPHTSTSHPIGQFPALSPLSLPPTSTLSAASRPCQSGVINPQSPPVIPPLSFENNEINNSTITERPRLQVQEPSSSAHLWMTGSDDLLRRQQWMRNLLRSYQNGQAPASTPSSSSSSMLSAESHGEQVSWSQLENSPESITGVFGPGSSSRISEMHHSRSGNVESLRNAIYALRGDGLSVDRSLQLLDPFRQQRAGGHSSHLGGREDERRIENQERRTRYQDEASRSYPRLRESETERGSQRGARSNSNVSRWPHTNNLPPLQMNLPSRMTIEERPPSVGATNAFRRPISAHNNSNNRASTEMDMQRLQALLEDTSDSESDISDNDRNNSIQVNWTARHPRPTTSSAFLSSASTTTTTTATVGRGNENSRNGRFGRQGRFAVDVNSNPTNSRMPGYLTRSSQVGNTAAENNETGGARILRERMLRRLRADPPNLSLETSIGDGTSGRRFAGGFTRLLGNLEDYLDDDEFDASYESLLVLQDALGEVKQKSTPEAVLRKLKKGKYREWAEEGDETRCPICLENYEMEDEVLKSGNCSHWMHQSCLETWFKKANTCPVCRMDVEPRPPTSALRGRHGRNSRSDRWRNIGTSNRNDGPSGVSTASEGFGSRPSGSTEATIAGLSRSSIFHSNEAGDDASLMNIGGRRGSVNFDPNGNVSRDTRGSS